jgi:hypothetical protein
MLIAVAGDVAQLLLGKLEALGLALPGFAEGLLGLFLSFLGVHQPLGYPPRHPKNQGSAMPSRVPVKGPRNQPRRRYFVEATAQQETGQVTGTKDKDYNVIWFTEQCLSNVLRLETYAKDAEREGDNDLAEFFRRAQQTSQKGAEQGKELLKGRLGS